MFPGTRTAVTPDKAAGAMAKSGTSLSHSSVTFRAHRPESSSIADCETATRR